MESLAYSPSKQVDPSQLENLHEFLCGYTDIFSKNVLSNNDETYKNLKNLIRKNDIVILRGDKDSSVSSIVLEDNKTVHIIFFNLKRPKQQHLTNY